jgi:hypothetical protein
MLQRWGGVEPLILLFSAAINERLANLYIAGPPTPRGIFSGVKVYNARLALIVFYNARIRVLSHPQCSA